MKRILPILILTLLLLPLEGRCEGERVLLGGYFSPKACGVTTVFPGEKVFHELRLSADLDGVIRGLTAYPGVRADWHMNYHIGNWKPSEEMQVRFYAGPGVMLGYVRDGDRGRGVAAALSGTIGAAFVFSSSPIRITLGFSGVLGCHATITGTRNSTLTLYRSGLRNTVIPELGIRYCF